jgi:GrpB-like predicted nucleotidyltransferase (UPF0157 family)
VRWFILHRAGLASCRRLPLSSNVRLHETHMSELVLSEYQDTWPRQFLLVAEQLRASVPAPGAVLEHIGSTSVPGLCAKPVLDVMLGVSSLAELEQFFPALGSAGFVYRPEYETVIPDRRYFVRPEGQTARVHLHVLLLGGVLWQQHVCFRNALREEPPLREQYATLKRALAVAHAGDKSAYTEAKAPFIRQVLASNPARATSALRSAA